MESAPYFEGNYEYLRDNIIIVTKIRQEQGIREMIFLRAKVLDINKNPVRLKVQFEGNDNLIFDNQIEENVTLENTVRDISAFPILESDVVEMSSEAGTYKNDYGTWMQIDES
jgi:hypothetical protein